MSGYWNIQLLNCFLTTLNFDLSFCSTNTVVNSVSLVVEICSSLLLPQIPPTRDKNKQPTHPLKRLGVGKNLQNLCFTADSVVLLSEMSHHQTWTRRKNQFTHQNAVLHQPLSSLRMPNVHGSIGLPFYERDDYIPSGRGANSWLNCLYM